MESREEEEVVRRWRGVGVAEREDEVEGREKGKERQRQRQRQSEGGMVVIEGDGGTDEETMMMERFVVGPKKRVQKGRKRRMIGGVERDVVEVLEGEEEEEIPVAAGRKRKGRE